MVYSLSASLLLRAQTGHGRRKNVDGELVVVISKRVIKPNDDPDPAPRAGCWLGTVSAEPGAGICHMLIPHLMPSYAVL